MGLKFFIENFFYLFLPNKISEALKSIFETQSWILLLWVFKKTLLIFMISNICLAELLFNLPNFTFSRIAYKNPRLYFFIIVIFSTLFVID